MRPSSATETSSSPRRWNLHETQACPSEVQPNAHGRFHSTASTHTARCVNSTLLPPRTGALLPRCAAVLGGRNVVEPTASNLLQTQACPSEVQPNARAGFHSPASTHTTGLVNSTLLPPRTGALLPPVCGRPRPQELHPAHGAESAPNSSLPKKIAKTVKRNSQRYDTTRAP